MAKPSHSFTLTESETELGFPSEFPYEFDSFALEHLISPLENVVCSTETASSVQEDLFAGLTRRLSQASLHENRPSQYAVRINTSNKTEIQKKARVISGSPESTLIGSVGWSGRSPGSGLTNPNTSSRILSSDTTAFSNDAWDTIHAAAEQVARSKIIGDVSNLYYHNKVHRGFPPHVAVENHTDHLLNSNNLNQAPHFLYLQLKQEQINTTLQMLKQQCGVVRGLETEPYLSSYQQQLEVQNNSCEFGYGSVKCKHHMPKSTWHPPQVKHKNQHVQPNRRSGSGPVLNGGSRDKRVCTGTGVFLPRSYMDPHEPHCTPLNLNIVDLNATTQQRFANAYDELLAKRNAIQMQQKLCLRREDARSYEIRLPQEWTY
ncbi:hypothetical protein TanjilG_29478 [Lupinus angustifolius]|uniref:Uncharacterized protein n=1 Tax=Lupinus angustifolius TaxID=3871 RepID=A0A394C711_LUPAN|nr:hypothetical protein TanjilG_29477 [Lupinus angustifolius]OIW02702.1 hypothetical protein TanjilG_29478 [Lupinus angustifolius]